MFLLICDADNNSWHENLLTLSHKADQEATKTKIATYNLQSAGISGGLV